jgi:hypothetical protein
VTTPAEEAAALESQFTLPAADVPPRTPREELLAAAKILHARDQWATNTLMWWLYDTAMIHAPLDGTCERDGDTWPCMDVQAAQKVAETIRIEGPAR